jgi:hypothetical protein
VADILSLMSKRLQLERDIYKSDTRITAVAFQQLAVVLGQRTWILVSQQAPDAVLLDLEHHRTILLCPYFDVTVHRKQHTKCSDTVSGHGTVQIRRCCDVFQGFFVQACQRSILILARGTGWHW